MEIALRLDIIIVNWNSGPLLARCIASVPRAVTNGVAVGAIVVVDNGSNDGSWRVEMPSGIDLVVIRNETNRGFAAACNQGAAATHAAFVLFLNPDAELTPDALASPLRRLVSGAAEGIGVIGVALVTPDGQRQRNTARFPTPARLLGQAVGLDRLLPRLVRPHFVTDWDHTDTRVVDQVPGAFMLLRRSDFLRVGGFDECFFVYMEDVDLAYRLRRMGLACLYMHDCTVRHVGGGTTDSVKDRRLFYMLRSRILYARKHFGIGGRVAVGIATLVLEPASRILQALVHRSLAEVRAVVRATVWLWRTYPYRSPADTGEGL